MFNDFAPCDFEIEGNASLLTEFKEKLYRLHEPLMKAAQAKVEGHLDLSKGEWFDAVIATVPTNYPEGSEDTAKREFIPELMHTALVER